jgi:hypothetical protein
MAAQDLEPADLGRVEVERFVQERRATRRVQLASERALAAAGVSAWTRDRADGGVARGADLGRGAA